MELQPGSTFAQRYRVQRLLARGGMGSVYVAQQLTTEALVALKVLDPRMLESESQCKAFKVEATVAARVRSHHIVRTLDAGYDEPTGLPFLVMELLEGEPLQELIEREGPLPAATVTLYVSQIASGLDRAHGYNVDGKPQPIIHRDLKPSNLMLTRRDDGQPEIKILDFGIAKVLGNTTGGVSREIKGTPSYMAFEQAAGESVSPQTDVWALGLIAFFLLTGKSYWRSASSPEGTLEGLLGEVLALPLSPATERMQALGVVPGWPTDAFDAWFARCVHREPAQRFASAGAAARALQQALLDASASAQLGTARTLWSQPPRPSSQPPSLPEAVRPRWPWLVALGVLLLVVGVGLALRAAQPVGKPDVVAGAANATGTAAPLSPTPPPPPPVTVQPPAALPPPTLPPPALPATALPATALPATPQAPVPDAKGPTRPVVRKRAAPRAGSKAEPTPSPIPDPAPDDLYNRR